MLGKNHYLERLLNQKGIVQLPDPRYNIKKQNINIKPVDFIEPQEQLNSEFKNYNLKNLKFELVTSLPQREM